MSHSKATADPTSTKLAQKARGHVRAKGFNGNRTSCPSGSKSGCSTSRSRSSFADDSKDLASRVFDSEAG